MIVRLGMAPRRDGLDFEGFQAHWRTSHADVVSQMPGLRQYDQFHAVLQGGRPLLPYPGFDACSALRFDDLAGMDAAFGSDTFQGAVQSDEAEFVDKTRFRGVIGSWRTEGPHGIGDLGAVVLLSLWRVAAGADPESLATRLADGMPTSAGLLVADRDAHASRFPVGADVVEASGHASVEDALHDLAARDRTAVPGDQVGQHIAGVVHVPIGTASAPTNQERTTS